MNGESVSVLPYRAGYAAIARWVEARARGESPARLRGRGLSPKTLEGVTVAVAALGLAEEDGGGLTSLGRAFALSGDAERRSILRAAVLAYEPYARLLESVRSAGRAVTDVQWMEAWWGTRGYGSSASNRAEGAAVLGRLAEEVDLGRYVPGRRGHATRVEWGPGVLGGGAVDPPSEGGREPVRELAPARREERSGTDGGGGGGGGGGDPVPGRARRGTGAAGEHRLEVSLGGGVARLRVPARLTVAEKRRLIQLLELLIGEDTAPDG